MSFSVMAGAWPDEGRAFVRTPYARPSTWFSLHATQMLGRQGGISIGNRGAVGRRGWPGRPETLCSIATSSSRVSEGTFILPCFEGTFCNRIMQRESPIISKLRPCFIYLDLCTRRVCANRNGGPPSSPRCQRTTSGAVRSARLLSGPEPPIIVRSAAIRVAVGDAYARGV